MAGALAPLIRFVVLDSDGAPSPGAKAYFYLSGTSTPRVVYSDAALATPRTNPVVADAGGVLPPIYFAAVAYRVTITDAAGATIYPATDDVFNFGQLYGVQADANGDVTIPRDLAVTRNATIAGSLTGMTRVSVTGGTVTVSTPAFNGTQTWNSAGVTFSGRLLNITDTASAAASLLDDLQVGGVSKWKVTKAGDGTLAGGLTIAGALSGVTTLAASGAVTLSENPATYGLIFNGSNGAGIAATHASGAIRFYTGGTTERMRINSSGNVGIGTDPSFGFHVLKSNAGQVVRLTNSHATTPSIVEMSFSGVSPNNATQWYIQLTDTVATRGEWRSNGGIANYSANNVNLSDMQTKDLTGSVESLRAKFSKIKLYRGRYKDSKRTADDVMWTAQEIAALDPNWSEVFQQAEAAKPEKRDKVTGQILEPATPARPMLLGTRDNQIFMANVAVTIEHEAQLAIFEARLAAVEAKTA
ncbi:MAG: hypothetical protein M3Q55_02605 [Acidobacteriota bacterium]|nr:hypothetical protein [Acidobacteriota bacterium]